MTPSVVAPGARARRCAARDLSIGSGDARRDDYCISTNVYGMYDRMVIVVRQCIVVLCVVQCVLGVCATIANGMPSGAGAPPARRACRRSRPAPRRAGRGVPFILTMRVINICTIFKLLGAVRVRLGTALCSPPC